MAEVNDHRRDDDSGEARSGAEAEEPRPGAETATQKGQRSQPELRHPPRPPEQQESDTADQVDAPSTGRVGPRGRFQAQTASFRAVSQRIHLGALVAGIVLVIFGLLLLGGTQFQWRGLLDAVLALVGLILIVRSRGAANVRGLLVVGVVLGLVMLSV